MNTLRFSNRLFILVFVLLLSTLACGASSEPTALPNTATPVPTQPEATQQTANDPQSLNSLEGTYNVSGTNPDGSEYGSTLTIGLSQSYTGSSVQLEVYDLTWDNGIKGAGILVDNLLASSFGKETCGAVFYGIESDMSLGGIWLTLDTKQLGTEAASPTAARTTLEGDYNISGTNADGSPYNGTLKMTQQGEVWQMIWDAGSVTDGIGISVADQLLAATYGGDGCGVVIYALQDDGSLKGVWGIWGYQSLGYEIVTK